MAPNKHIAAGTQFAFLGLLDSAGFFSGNTGTAPSGGATGQPMSRLLGIKTANPGPVEPEAVNVTGDDTTLGAIDFGPNAVPTWIMELGAFDLANQALMQETSVETIGGISLGVLQPNDPNYPDCFLIYQSKSKYKDTGSDGIKAWSGMIIPLCSVIPLGRAAFEERTPGVERYKVTAQVASRKPWGVTIIAADLGTTGAPIITFTSDYPITMERLTGNGVLSTFNLTNIPVSTANMKVFVDTAPVTPSSISVASKTFTLGSVPANGAKIEVLYGFAA